MRWRWLVATFFLPGMAAAEPIYPDLIAGEYEVRVMPAPVALDGAGVPTETPALSIAVIRPEGEPVACVNDPPQGVWTPVSYSLPARPERQDLVAVAYSERDCEGLASPHSARTAYHFVGMVPHAPALTGGPE